MQKSAGVVVAERPITSAIFEARLQRLALPAIEAQIAAGVGASVLGLHVQYAGIPEAVSDRQNAIQQAHSPDEEAIEDLAETAEAIHRHHDPVDAPLNIFVFAIDVDLRLVVLNHTGHLEKDFVDGGVLTLRKRGDVVLGQRILAVAGP